ncbi:hypothetical protein I7I50_08439 [Histoplasma capsulatum G186AR]|uniref:Uncharacterized protein n=1 Tax=Ajellomyces capsulatus TaxID=5037 RepID=A0A8H8CZP7_AJECA|nr:hypothetical protein I7I52_05954 [Histoplasma capsulatum]QSS73603.1 hypothetical protein I7I50_08439 [Histoplasma capsulatum G186AR]
MLQRASELQSFRVLLARRQRAASNCWIFFSSLPRLYLSTCPSSVLPSDHSIYHPSSSSLLLLPNPTDTPSLLHKACWPSFTPFLAVYNS